MEQEGGLITKDIPIIKTTPQDTPQVPQPLGARPKEIKSYWAKSDEQQGERGVFGPRHPR